MQLMTLHAVPGCSRQLGAGPLGATRMPGKDDRPERRADKSRGRDEARTYKEAV